MDEEHTIDIKNKMENTKIKSKFPKYLVGVDEVGRGPLAGPVCIGICIFPRDRKHKVWKDFQGVKDSKQLSEKQRKDWLLKLKEKKEAGIISFYTSFASHIVIDRSGISQAVRMAIKRAFKKSNILPRECEILLDGSLRAPPEFFRQKTIIKGDMKEPIIAMASIVAKVKRDAKMVRMAKKFPEYGFHIHKGYGTRKHIEILKKNGPCGIHRKSFLNFLKETEI